MLSSVADPGYLSRILNFIHIPDDSTTATKGGEKISQNRKLFYFRTVSDKI
jgi:hypothetical protein